MPSCQDNNLVLCQPQKWSTFIILWNMVMNSCMHVHLLAFNSLKLLSLSKLKLCSSLVCVSPLQFDSWIHLRWSFWSSVVSFLSSMSRCFRINWYDLESSQTRPNLFSNKLSYLALKHIFSKPSLGARDVVVFESMFLDFFSGQN